MRTPWIRSPVIEPPVFIAPPGSPRWPVDRGHNHVEPAWLRAGRVKLVSFDLATPNIAATSVPVVGLTAGETLVGIDFRPLNGLLYGLGVNAGADTGTLYVISTRTGVAGAVGSFAGAGDLPPGNFGFDFNPSVDRIRVTTDTGLNFRLNPNSGAIAASTRRSRPTTSPAWPTPITGRTTATS